ncbi:hypothetical protein [Methylobacterium sp. Leaf118]|uniref:hypothetical protein n=1 Tax=Methylobacterium sp. Leaf118 TaxID=2876562 RepID=UPI001E4238F8|nr:hypothetical protein [Methylobacterium sp. Leaf118]
MRAPLLPILALALGLAAPCAAAPGGYDAMRQEAACPRDREPKPLRQTVIVLDEAIVEAKSEANALWKRIVVEAADAREVGTGTLSPRERLTLLVARRDGSEMLPLFVGCSPNLPAEEIERARAADTQWQVFTGDDSGARHKKTREAFANGLARAMAQIAKRAEAIAAVPAPPGALLRALQNAGRLADPNHGLPRFILVSPFAVIAKGEAAEAAGAREKGFALAERSGLDFGRAEIYLAGAQLGDGASLDFARALVLGAKGVLVASRSDGLPRLQPEPVSLRTYAGFIDYVDQRVPLQLRLAATAQGDLVNSWIETTFSKSTATPVAGKMLCRGTACEVRGDGRFAQVWFLEPQGEPKNRAKLPFGGARNLELTLKDKTASGRISDPSVVFGGVNAPKRDDLRFEIERVEDGQF